MTELEGFSGPPTQLVLSLFPGIDLLGRAFEAEGFCVVRGPDLLWGGDVRRFTVPPGRFDGIIGGPPCQDFSSLHRSHDPFKDGLEMIGHFLRVVRESGCRWFLMENVKSVPGVAIGGFPLIQRIDLRGGECGIRQRRLRHFQFGSRDAAPLAVDRSVTLKEDQKPALASEGRREGCRGWPEFCALMGLPEPLELPGWSKRAKYQAVGNGVPLPMGRLIARAIRLRDVRLSNGQAAGLRLCACGCGRTVDGKRRAAGAACRKRLERQRRGLLPGGGKVVCDSAGVTGPGTVTPGLSRFGKLAKAPPHTGDGRDGVTPRVL